LCSCRLNFAFHHQEIPVLAFVEPIFRIEHQESRSVNQRIQAFVTRRAQQGADYQCAKCGTIEGWRKLAVVVVAILAAAVYDVELLLQPPLTNHSQRRRC
jgi:hypothetical protein